MKMSRACPGMLSSENDDFKFFKKCEKHEMHLHHVHHSSRARSKPACRRPEEMNVTVAEYFPKFRSW